MDAGETAGNRHTVTWYDVMIWYIGGILRWAAGTSPEATNSTSNLNIFHLDRRVLALLFTRCSKKLTRKA